ncbi:MAG: phytoene/squalene synthase family protein [Myxococcales bacterium]
MSQPNSPSHALALRECREILEQNSKSFALAARFLAPDARDRAAAVYAYCRRVDDAIDDAPAAEQPAALERLKRELEECYAEPDMATALGDPALRAFRAVALNSGLPIRYPRELIDGMGMDVLGARYETLDDLLLYCHRVAGVVGLMMCHVFGITRDDALLPAAHLGIAMQLTNICRDVQEDWGLGRLYLPRRLLLAAGATQLPRDIRGPFPSDPALLSAMQEVMRTLLREADRYYTSAERGISALPFTAGLAVRAASRLYHAIGLLVAARDYDPRCGRAVVPTPRKLALALSATRDHAREFPRFLDERLVQGQRARPPARQLDFPEDVLPAATEGPSRPQNSSPWAALP